MALFQCSFYSPALKKNAVVQVIIPTTTADDYLYGGSFDYFAPETQYKTLFLLHGSYGDCNDWLRRTSVERYAEDHKIALVMPSAENSSYLNMARGENYLQYVGEELPAFMRNIFPLSRKREDTFIAGLSMGGYGSFRIAFEYPQTFGYAASISGALDMAELHRGSEEHISKMPLNYRKAVYLDPQNAPDSESLYLLLKAHIEKGTDLPKLYMCCGREDFVLPTNEDFAQKAAALGLTIPFETHPGVHDWNYWDAHVQDVINWLPHG